MSAGGDDDVTDANPSDAAIDAVTAIDGIPPRTYIRNGLLHHERSTTAGVGPVGQGDGK